MGAVLSEVVQWMFILKDAAKAGIWTARTIQKVVVKGGGLGGFFLEAASEINGVLRIFEADSTGHGPIEVADAESAKKLKAATEEAGNENYHIQILVKGSANSSFCE